MNSQSVKDIVPSNLLGFLLLLLSTRVCEGLQSNSETIPPGNRGKGAASLAGNVLLYGGRGQTRLLPNQVTPVALQWAVPANRG